MTEPSRLAAARAIAARYGEFSPVTAVTLGGSQTAAAADAGSDIDLYVYAEKPLPIAARSTIARDRASHAEVDNQFWEPGDEWLEAETGLHVDVMFRLPAWIEDQVALVLDRHEASLGYSTCLWHNVLTSRALFDRDGWWARLHEGAQRPYPEPLARAIIAKNLPVLRDRLSSYAHQLDLAAKRRDIVSSNHRIAALLASYFDVLFALNRAPHPGEKRLLAAAARLPLVPHGMTVQVTSLLSSAASAPEAVVPRVHALLEELDALLTAHGEFPHPVVDGA